MVHFTIAVSGAGSGSSEKDSAGFIDCKIWLSENDYVVPAEVKYAREGFKSGEWKKGTRLHVMGRLIQERWEKDGEKRTRIIIQADKIQAMFVRSNSDQASSTGSSSESPNYTSNTNDSSIPEVF